MAGPTNDNAGDGIVRGGFLTRARKNYFDIIWSVVIDYHMTYTLTRTSMALDQGTLKALKDLASRWGISKAEVMRRAVRKAKEEADREAKQPKPLQALD